LPQFAKDFSRTGALGPYRANRRRVTGLDAGRRSLFASTSVVSASERLLASFYGLTVVPDQRKVTGHSTSDATLRFTGQARAPEGEGQALSFVVRRAALAFR
jgi:hypothetical protein